MMGLGMFLGGLAGAGSALDKFATNSQRMDDEQRLMEERNRLEIDRQKAIEQNRIKLQTEPLNRFSAIMRDELSKDVQVAPDAVKTIGQDSAKEIGLEQGLSGDVSALRSQWKKALENSTTDEQRQTAQEILNQIDSQEKAQGLINRRLVEGQTRKPTSDEAFEAAYRRALAEDPTAAIAVHPIRKDERAERKLDQEVEYNRDRNARLEKKEDQMNAWRMRQEERRTQFQEESLELQRKESVARTDREAQQAINGQRAATIGALNSAEKEIQALNKQMLDPMLSTEQKAAYEEIRKSLTSEAKQYRKALAAQGFELPEPEKETPTKESIEKLIANRSDQNVRDAFKKRFGIDPDVYLKDLPDQTPSEKAESSRRSAYEEEFNQKVAADKASRNQVTIPAPPEKFKWVGNEKLVTPEFLNWEAKYKDAYKKQEDERAVDFARRMSNSKL